MTIHGTAINVKSKMLIPNNEDWGEINDLDVRYSYEYFFGKSNTEMQDFFRRNVIERCDNLRFMPIKPFQYYIFGLKEYLESDTCPDKADAASCFLELIQERFESNYDDMMQIIELLMPAIRMVVENQENFGADIDIYGDFSDMLSNINSSRRAQ
jgi:hypothetical protein